MEKNQINELLQNIWKTAGELRGKMTPGDFIDYLTGLLVYKFLSDQTERAIGHALIENGEATECDLLTLQQCHAAYMNHGADDALCMAELGYIVSLNDTFQSILHRVYDGMDFLAELQNAFFNIENSNPDLTGLFDDVDLQSARLGSSVKSREELIGFMLKGLEMTDTSLMNGDYLGQVFEALIRARSQDAGRATGEIYTPKEISDIMARITTHGHEKENNFSIYDPVMGSGSLLLRTGSYIESADSVHYYGQEINTSTWNKARMNFILHEVISKHINLSNGNTLDQDWPKDDKKVSAVVMNPPYSMHWSADPRYLTDARFADYGVLPPKSKADFAFLLHGLHHLSEDGTMAILLPHGVLFRGAAEEKIRKQLLDNGLIDAVIGLPAGLLSSTAIPTAIIVLKKNRTSKDVLFIDASNEYTSDKRNKILEPKHIDRICQAYFDRKNVDQFCHVASYEEIQANDYNLNIPRYVDTFVPEDGPSIEELTKTMKDASTQLAENQAKLQETLKSLIDIDSEAAEDVKAVQDALK